MRFFFAFLWLMKAKKAYFLISLGFFVILLILGVLFAQERILFLDNALQLFLLINDKSIEVMAGRYPAVIARILPFIGVKLQLNLATIIYLFSISYILIQLSFVLAAHLLLKDKRWLLAIVLSIALVLGNSFFWCNSELSQAIPFSILSLGLSIEALWKNRFRKATITTILVSTILAFYHPQSLMVFIFGLLFLLPIKWEKRKGYILPILAIIIFVAKSIYFKNWYDTIKFEGLTENLKNLYPNYLSTQSFIDFYHWLPNQLILAFTIFFVCIVYMMIQRKWYQFFLLITSSILSISVFHITNEGGMTVFYAEAGYLVWSGLLAVAFIFAVFDDLNYKKLIYSILLLACLAKILFVSDFYLDRLNQVAEQVAINAGQKLIIDRKSLPQKYFKLDWALPFETYIYSTLKKQIPPTIIVSANSKEEYEDYLDGKYFINGMGEVLKSEIDSNYFQWIKGPYRLDF